MKARPAFLAVVATTLVLAPTASAVPSWQAAQSPPPGMRIVGQGGGTVAGQFSRTWLDASGNASSIVSSVTTGTPYRLGVRPAGGSYGAATALPIGIGQTGTPPQFATNLAGDALLWDFNSRRSAFRAAGAASVFGAPTGAGTGIADVGVAPTGQALALSDSSNGTRVLFRPAGADASFDEAHPVALPTAGGDTQSTPIGIAYDNDGQATAVYRSKPSLTLLQTTTSGNPPVFGQPVAIPTSATRHVFDASADGHAIVAWGTDLDVNLNPTKIVAAVRSPGGAFGAPETVVQTGGGNDTIGKDFWVAATDSGHPVVAYTRYPAGIGSGNCRPPAAIVQVVARSSGIWQPPALVADDYTQLERLASAGDQLALAMRYESYGSDADPCTSADNTGRLDVGVSRGADAASGSSGLFHAQQTLVTGGAGTAIYSEDLAVGSGGSALLVYTVGTTQFVRAYEDPDAIPPPSDPGPGTGTGGGGGGTGGGGGSTPLTPTVPGPALTPPKASPPIVAPGGIKLTGPVKVDPTGRIILRGECFVESTPCRFIFVLGRPLGGNARISAAKLRQLATVKATVPAGKTKNVSLRLNATGRRLMRGKRSLGATLRVTITAGKRTTTINRKVTLRRGAVSRN